MDFSLIVSMRIMLEAQLQLINSWPEAHFQMCIFQWDDNIPLSKKTCGTQALN